MLNFGRQSDETFIRDALDASKRAEALRREKRNQSLSTIAGLLAIAVWIVAQWEYLTGSGGDMSTNGNFLFLCLALMTAVGSLHARSNVRLLRGLQALEEKLTS
jgi:hypothetical protein